MVPLGGMRVLILVLLTPPALLASSCESEQRAAHESFLEETAARWARPGFVQQLFAEASFGSCTSSEACRSQQQAAAAIRAPPDNPFDDCAHTPFDERALLLSPL